MKLLAVLGTVAMFLVGGGILLHGWPTLAHALEAWTGTWPGMLSALVTGLAGMLLGVVAGALVLGGVMLLQRVRGQEQTA
jgi:predicted DNA repair protein MutK